MSGALLAAAAAAFVSSACAYFVGRFAAAALLGIVCLGAAAPAAIAELGRPAGAVAVLLLAVAPGLYLVLHAVDVRRGLFLLPTVYSIPLAFVCALLLLLLVAVGLVV